MANQSTHKFADDLEDILKCLLCYESLSRTIPLCIQGHHVCQNCQPQINECPYCKSHFNGTRNYLAEDLVTKFDEIKSSLLDPTNAVNKKRMISVQTQTGFEIVKNATNEINMIVEKPLINYEVCPIVGKGYYPCKIGNCNQNLPYGRMVSHLRYYHQNALIEEKISNSRIYENSWEISYKLSSVHEKAIYIPNMGLFFINVSINEKGDIYGIVQIVNKRIVAKEFEYNLELSNSHNSSSFKGTVIGVRTRQYKNNHNFLFINSEFMTHMSKKKRPILVCRLILTRTFKAEVANKKI